MVIEEGRLVETPVNGKMTIERLATEDSIILKNGSWFICSEMIPKTLKLFQNIKIVG